MYTTVSLLLSFTTYGQNQIPITDSNLLNLAAIAGTGILAFGVANGTRTNWSDRTAYRTAELMQGLQTPPANSPPTPNNGL